MPETRNFGSWLLATGCAEVTPKSRLPDESRRKRSVSFVPNTRSWFEAVFKIPPPLTVRKTTTWVPSISFSPSPVEPLKTSLSSGLVVPIPTRPDESIRSFSEPSILKLQKLLLPADVESIPKVRLLELSILITL